MLEASDSTPDIGISQQTFEQSARYGRWLAIKGFYALGSAAKTALKELLEKIDFPGPDADRAYALAGIGVDAIARLTASCD